ncbi:MAG: hypothetical protein LC667_17025, partial [Thioalkalivibrio sp.]|nr:hypothetical protein [Thioalkalivibrio sp.]
RRGLSEAAALLLAGMGAGAELVLVPSVDGVPLGTARYPAVSGSAFDGGGDVDDALGRAPRMSLSLSDVSGDLLRAPRVSTSYGRVDVVVHPWFEASFGNVNPVASRTGVAPEARVAFHRGLTLSAQALITLQDDIPTGESRVRPGLLTVTQRLRLGDAVLLSATVGAFNPNRYGIDVEGRAYSPDGRFSAGAELAFTGIAVYGARDWYYTPMDEPTALADVAWRQIERGLTLRLTGGLFTTGEAALRLDVGRQFGSTEIGFFAVQGETETNFGFRLVIPLPGARYGALGRARLRLAESYAWEYRYHARSVAGRAFRTGSTIDDDVRWWMVP